jgi:hypothetical protein
MFLCLGVTNRLFADRISQFDPNLLVVKVSTERGKPSEVKMRNTHLLSTSPTKIQGATRGRRSRGSREVHRERKALARGESYCRCWKLRPKGRRGMLRDAQHDGGLGRSGEWLVASGWLRQRRRTQRPHRARRPARDDNSKKRMAVISFPEEKAYKSEASVLIGESRSTEGLSRMRTTRGIVRRQAVLWVALVAVLCAFKRASRRANQRRARKHSRARPSKFLTTSITWGCISSVPTW